MIRDIPKRAEHDEMPPLPSCSIGLRVQENPKQLFVWGGSGRAQQTSEAAMRPWPGFPGDKPGPGQDLRL